MANLQYIGARYVPKFYLNPDDSSNDWKSSVLYEALTIVTYNDDSYTSKKTVPSSVGNPADNPEYWALTGNYNANLLRIDGDISDLNNTVDGLDNDVNDPATGLKTKVNALENKASEIDVINEIINSGKPLIADLLLNHIYDRSTFPYGCQGACYVKDNKIVTYYASTSSNVGYLICFDIENMSEVWRYGLALYHGNSITYNPNNNKLYVSGCYSVSPITYINKVFEIDFDNPSIIEREIALPDTTTNYSLAYDPITRQFYATNNTGVIDGVANKITVYDETLTNVIREIVCDHYPSVDYHLSTQGVQIGYNGIAYVLVYTEPYYIAGYDVITGDLVSVYNLPSYASEVRKISEVEAIMFDSDNKNMYIAGVSYTKDIGFEGYQSTNIIEVNAFHSIEYHHPVAVKGSVTDFEGEFLQCNMKSSSLTPSFRSTSGSAVVDSLQDACNYARKYGFVRVGFPATIEIDTAYCPNFNGIKIRIQGYNNNHFKLKGVNACDTDAAFWYCDFVDSFEWATSLYTNARFGVNSKVYLQSCTFEDNSSIPDVTLNHLVLYWNSYASTNTVTYYGGYGTDVLVNHSTLNGVYTG